MGIKQTIIELKKEYRDFFLKIAYEDLPMALLEKLRILGNLSNKANYNYTDEEIRKIFNSIDTQLRTVKARFALKQKKKFSL